MKIQKIDIRQMGLLKGVGIFLIVLHNLWYSIIKLKINEFDFKKGAIGHYIDRFSETPLEIFSLLVGFFGHYGVGFFVFASAYGVTISLTKKPRPFLLFMKERFSKVYIAFLIAVVFYLLYIYFYAFIKVNFFPLSDAMPNDYFSKIWVGVVLKILLISNLVPEQALFPVGPWWFIPFIFQMYLMLPFLIWLHKKKGDIILVFAAVFGYMLELWQPFGFVNVNFTPLGHLPIICFGIWMSYKKELNLPFYALLILLIIFYFSQDNLYFWIVGDIIFFVISLLLLSYSLFKVNLTNWFSRFFTHLAHFSLYIFLVNGFLRRPLIRIYHSIESWWGFLVVGITILLISVVVAVFLTFIEKKLRVLFKENNLFAN